jgi:hypothetical protein
MRQAREIIRTKVFSLCSDPEIARRLGVAASTVPETLKRFESAGLSWPLPGGMSDGHWRRKRRSVVRYMD